MRRYETAAGITALLFTEGHAICALVNGGIALMGTNQDLVKRTEICVRAVMCALRNRTLNGFVGMAIHL